MSFDFQMSLGKERLSLCHRGFGGGGGGGEMGGEGVGGGAAGAASN